MNSLIFIVRLRLFTNLLFADSIELYQYFTMTLLRFDFVKIIKEINFFVSIDFIKQYPE